MPISDGAFAIDLRRAIQESRFPWAERSPVLTVPAYIEVTEAAQGIEFYCDGLDLTVKRRLSPRWIRGDHL
jgi:hypothetical protein